MALTFYEQDLDVTKQEIRLLELLPGQSKDRVSCVLKVISLQDGQTSVPYEALSYVWGEIEGTAPIQVCGGDFEITRNLRAALRRLRHKDRSRLLWVDAVCINQRNIQERNDQVRLMGSVYEKASKVVVWLGVAADDTKETVEFIRRMAGDNKIHWTPQKGHMVAGGEAPGAIHGLQDLALFVFFRRSWWTRMWTLQEIAKAKEVVFTCGKFTIPGEVMNSLVESFFIHCPKCCTNMNYQSSGVDALPDLENRMVEISTIERLRKSRQRQEFLQLARLYRHRNATDPRDMIYGLLGMSSDLDDGIINYRPSVPETYEIATLEIISRIGNLDIFSHILEHEFRGGKGGYGGGGIRGLPSWVPDWSEEYKFTTLRFASFRQEAFELFNASGSVPMNRVSVAPGQLALDGLDFDEVEKFGSQRRVANMEENDIYGKWRLLANVDKSPEHPYVGGKTTIDAYWRTLCYNMSVNEGKEATTEDRMLHDEWWWGAILSESRPSHWVYKQKQRENIKGVSRMSNIIASCTAGRRFFITKKGYFGIGPAGIVVGDRVCILFGGKTPFILRKTLKQSEMNSDMDFEYVGDTYIHGLMGGEAVKLMESGELSSQAFTLS
ncbi:hypothetical protein G7Y89_g12010 [Cudoniella acicularis]|uniref:Heterokaryon incompatibility domain-containing protein n=1 Tax=Cudoniella acicularis TaxID=354080 RepID=A0A8H4RCN0_9HELO|nr:hypothetical protein G7Y89_g12010 [Cudoniella acicularis]